MKFNLKKIALAAVALVATASTMTSCVDNDDDNTTGGGARTFALVTYTVTETILMGDGGNGYVSTFAYYGADNTAANCRSTYETRLPKDVAEAGQRMVIGYTLNNSNSTPYPSGAINVMSYVLVPTISLQTGTHEEATANNAPMAIYNVQGQPSINRTGNYINLEIYMPYFADREFSIIADESTLSTDTPELYISTKEKGQGSGTTAVQMASFEITDVWRNPSVTGVKIHVNNTAGNQLQVFEFKK